jgi:ATP-dependent Clp protease ATP-binding subunit ClpA
MSEYMEKHAISKMIGSPPGYVGYEEAGQLTEQIRRKQYSVVLFDEIEKAHPDVFNVLLQILDDGHLTDAKGRKVNFKNTIIIMTSNIGSGVIQEYAKRHAATIGFREAAEKEEAVLEKEMEARVRELMQESFKPEFLNRVDEVIIFHALNKQQLQQIVEIQLRGVTARLAERKVSLTFTDALKTFLAEKGFDQVYGARPMKRVIQNDILNLLSREIIAGTVTEGTSVVVDYADDKVLLQVNGKPTGGRRKAASTKAKKPVRKAA